MAKTEAQRDGDEQEQRSHAARLAARVREEIDAISPERTRAATFAERMTVSRLSWPQIVKLNRYLEVLGRLTTLIYCVFIVTLLFGVDWRHGVQDTFNAGQPVRGVLATIVVLPTLLFVALHSITGYGRWRLQRELWRRDVAEMTEGLGEVAAEASRRD